MTRPQMRILALIFLFAFGIWLIWIGDRGWRINGAPAAIAGIIVLMAGVAGLLGVNIWYGGILDPRDDWTFENKRRFGPNQVTKTLPIQLDLRSDQDVSNQEIINLTTRFVIFIALLIMYLVIFTLPIDIIITLFQASCSIGY